MKRLHVHVRVADLIESVNFYTTLFGSTPTVQKSDYAKWMLDDPRVNFAISNRGVKTGVDHLGIQAEDAAELADLKQRLDQATLPSRSEENANCCYAESNKHWTVDPQGIAWESFHTLANIPIYGTDTAPQAASACCAPGVAATESCGKS